MPGGLYRNKEHLKEKIALSPEVPEDIADICFDPQTSGGLLISVPQEKGAKLLSLLRDRGVEDAAVVGEVLEPREHGILLEP